NVVLPPLFRVNVKENGNVIRQLIAPSWKGKATVEPLEYGRARGFTIAQDNERLSVRLLTNGSQPSGEWTHALQLHGLQLDHATATEVDLSEARWIKHPDARPELSGLTAFEENADAVRGSWTGALPTSARTWSRVSKGFDRPSWGRFTRSRHTGR